jgi:hypothetical protein
VQAWRAANAADVKAVVSGATAVLEVLRSHPIHCNPTPSGGTNCGTVTGNPTNWPAGLTDQQCSTLSGAVTKARSDPPVPSATAEHWWTSALSQLTAACHNVELAVLAYNSPSGPDESTYVPTLTGIQADLTEIKRLNQYASARVQKSVQSKRNQ